MINAKEIIECKEVIATKNEDSTYKIELTNCKFKDSEKEIEANLVFPKVSASIDNGILSIYDFYADTSTGSEMVTITVSEW